MAYNKQDFDFHMTQLDKVHKGIRPYLESVGLEKWGRAYSPKLRYGVMTSNLAESMNNKDKKARDMPVAAL